MKSNNKGLIFEILKSINLGFARKNTNHKQLFVYEIRNYADW